MLNKVENYLMNKDAPLLIGSSGQQSKSEEDELCEMDV